MSVETTVKVLTKAVDDAFASPKLKAKHCGAEVTLELARVYQVRR